MLVVGGFYGKTGSERGDVGKRENGDIGYVRCSRT
jgi:hypothetical protein